MKAVVIRSLRVFPVAMLVFAVLALGQWTGFSTTVSLASPDGVVAQANPANTGIQIQNLGTGTATVSVTFYQQGTGTQFTLNNVPTIPQGGSITIFNPSELPAGFIGSAVVSSDQPVAAIAKTIWPDKASAAYTGFSSGSSSFFMPLVLREYFNQNARITAQNTGTSSASVTIKVLGPGATAASPTFQETKDIAAGNSFTWDMATLTQLGTKFIGSARIESTGKVAAVGEVRIGAAGAAGTAVYAYNGFASGGTTLVAPLVRKKHAGGYTTGIQVQNVGSAATTVTVAYSNGTSESKALNPNESFNFFQGSNASLNDGFLGSATITSGSVPVVAMVNDFYSVTGSSASYEAFPPSVGTTKIVVPLVRNRHVSGLDMTTGVQVANVGSQAANVKITYTIASGSASLSAAQQSDTATVGVGQSQTFYQGGKYVSSSATLPGNWLGSAIVESTNGVAIVAIVNDISLASPPAFEATIFDALNTQ